MKKKEKINLFLRFLRDNDIWFQFQNEVRKHYSYRPNKTCNEFYDVLYYCCKAVDFLNFFAYDLAFWRPYKTKWLRYAVENKIISMNDIPYYTRIYLYRNSASF